MRFMVCWALVLGLMGCTSVPEPHFYTFDMRSSGKVDSSVSIDVDRLDTAEAIARPDIMILTAPTEIEYYATHRWVAGLSELVAEKLENEFGGASRAEPYLLNGEILAVRQEDTDEGANAHIKLRLRAFVHNAKRDAPPVLDRTYSATIAAASGDPRDVVKALSAALETIAEELASDLEDI